MVTMHTCATPEDGWALCSHFIGNLFLAIEWATEEVVEEDEVNKKKQAKTINDIWAKLVGSLYMVVHRMESNYHYNDAIRMRLILDMVVELGVAESEARAAIRREFHRTRISMTGYR